MLTIEMAPSTTAGSSSNAPPSSPNHRRAHDESSVPLRRSPRRAARRAPWDAVPDDTLARALSFVDARCLVEGACPCCRRLRDLLCDEGSAPGRALSLTPPPLRRPAPSLLRDRPATWSNPQGSVLTQIHDDVWLAERPFFPTLPGLQGTDVGC